MAESSTRRGVKALGGRLLSERSILGVVVGRHDDEETKRQISYVRQLYQP